MAEQSVLGARALLRIPNNGATRAARLADIYIKTHSNADGKVTDPTVYQNAIDAYLSPFADNLVVQQKIAGYQNTMKSVAASADNADESVAALRLKEHAAWYVNEDEVDSTGFRNPAYVAQVTSESLDQLVGETVAQIQTQAANSKDTSGLETYLNELMKKADRMRTLSNSINDGSKVALDGYGYYIDSDPNTGKVRGASLMPTDAGSTEIGGGTVRTDSMVQVGDKSVPVYLPYIKDASGQTQSTFAGKTYTGDTNLMSADGGGGDVALTDRTGIPSAGDTFDRGKVYRSFTGKVNVDGSPQQSYYFAGFDNKMYNFSDQTPEGKAFLDSLKATGQVDTSNIPRISPYTAATIVTQPLPSNNPQFQRSTSMGLDINKRTEEAAAATAEADRLANRSGLQSVVDELPNLPGNLANAAKGAFGAVAGFFSRKNKQAAPQSAPARTGADVIDRGSAFFDASGSALQAPRTP